jgi:LmbE family N-acetylglucosaminyl deacetylase
MLSVNFFRKHKEDVKILCLGAHSDDIEIGCGGTILSMLKRYSNAEVYWVIFSSDLWREEEARSSVNLFLKDAGTRSIIIEKYQNGFFPYNGEKIKEFFEVLKNQFSPNVIFTHYRMDQHQDHRTISELTWNTFRNHLILEYEIPKYDGDIGNPNFFVPLEYSICNNKIVNILSSFKSQREKHWFTEELLLSILRIRGMESASPTNYAEAFYCRKILMKFNLCDDL